MSGRLSSAHAVAAAVVLLLWLSVLTFAVHGCGRRRSTILLHHRHQPVSINLPAARKMLLAVSTTFDAASSSPSSSTTTTDHHQQQKHDRHNHHHHHSLHHGRHHHHLRGGGGGDRHDRWNRQGVPPPAGQGEEVDPRFGVQKRLVPTGPNPLHH